MSTLSISAQRELRMKQNELLELSNRPSLTAAEKRKFDGLLAEISLLKSGAISDEVRHAEADQLAKEFGFAPRSARSAEREELRQYLKSAAETRTYSPITSPNSLTPAAFVRDLLTGIAAYDPIFSKDNIRLIELDNNRALTIPALDLTQVTAVIVGQAQDLAPSVNPIAGKMSLGTFTYRSNPVAATMELEQDSFESISEILTQAFQVGMARGIGADLINGNGSTAPEGLLTAASDSGVVTALNTAITADEISDIYFSVNRAYRSSPKCAWVMADSTYEMVRKAVDQNLRPLLSMSEDGEKLMGKKILISPSMPTGAAAKAICFGDLSQYTCRVNRSNVRVTRATQAPGYCELGIALYTAWLSLDAKLNTVGTTSPVTYATLAS